MGQLKKKNCNVRNTCSSCTCLQYICAALAIVPTTNTHTHTDTEHSEDEQKKRSRQTSVEIKNHQRWHASCMEWENTHRHTRSEWNFAQFSFFNHFLRRNQVPLLPTYVYEFKYIMKENFSHTFLKEQQQQQQKKRIKNTKQRQVEATCLR